MENDWGKGEKKKKEKEKREKRQPGNEVQIMRCFAFDGRGVPLI